MVHPGRREGCEIGVALVASNRGRQVFHRFAERIGSVVTSSTTTDHHASMGIARRLPGRCAVTGIAGLRPCRDVRYRLRGRVGGGKSTVMAGEAVPCSDRPGRPGMTHRRRRENRVSGVACTALRRRWDVARRLG